MTLIASEDFGIREQVLATPMLLDKVLMALLDVKKPMIVSVLLDCLSDDDFLEVIEGESPAM